MDTILDRLHAELGIAVLIQGGQKFFCNRRRRFVGADYQAKVWAEKRGVPASKSRPIGRSAGAPAKPATPQCCANTSPIAASLSRAKTAPRIWFPNCGEAEVRALTEYGTGAFLKVFMPSSGAS